LVRSRTRFTAIGVGALAAALLVSAGPPPLVGAQTATPFPRSIIAFLPPTVAGSTEPALAIQMAAAADATGVGSDGSRSVTVTFAAAFALPAGAYRVSVVVGDPVGDRTRASFTSSAGVEAGTVETSADGIRWTAAGATRATFAADSVLIDVPVTTSMVNPALWVEAQIDDDPARLSGSPAYALDAFLGRVTDGLLPATAWAEPAVAPGGLQPTGVPIVAVPGAPPTVSVVNRALVVDETDRVPAVIAGQAVVGAGDDVTFMPGFTPSGAIPSAVHIDRSTGAIATLKGIGGLPDDVSGDRSWLIQGLPPGDPGAPAKVVIDLEGVATVLGLPLGDAAALGIGLRRTFTLADGSTITGASVLGALDWFQRAVVPEEPAPSSIAPGGPATSSSSLDRTRPLLIAVGVVFALGLTALLLTRRRRRLEPVVADGPTPGPAPEPAPEPDAAAEDQIVAAVDHERPDDPGRGRRSPEDALAALDAEVGELIARVDQLRSDPSGQPRSDPRGQGTETDE